MLPIGLQLYTVRDTLAKDYEGTLRQVAQIGYRYAEMAGLGGKTPEQVRELCREINLQPLGAHAGLDELKSQMPALIQQAKTLSYKYVTCSYLAENFRTPEGYREAAKQLGAAGKQLADAGLQLCYHNHAFEFEKLADGSNGYTILTQSSDPKLVQFELDVMWARWGGENPVAWMKKLKGRVPLVHMKDTPGQAAGGKKFTEVGTGIVDINAVVKAAPSVGSKFLIVEQDSDWTGGSPLQSASISFQNLSKIAAG
jgi:sugar phosphate isomerase/epimerase